VLNFEIERAMNRWVTATTEVVCRRRKLERTVSKLMHRGAARVFTRWTEWLADERRQRAVMKYVGAHIMLASKARCFNSWKAATAGPRLLRQRATAAIKIRNNLGLYRAFHSWQVCLLRVSSLSRAGLMPIQRAPFSGVAESYSPSIGRCMRPLLGPRARPKTG
jgi:hypothetical protein